VKGNNLVEMKNFELVIQVTFRGPTGNFGRNFASTMNVHAPHSFLVPQIHGNPAACGLYHILS